MGAKAMHHTHRTAYCRGLPTCGLGELVHHDVWLPVGGQRDQILGACDAGTAEESGARLDHLLKRIRGPTLVSVSRLRTHLLRRRPDRPNRKTVAPHLRGEIGAGCNDDLMLGLLSRVHERQHRIEVSVERVGGEQHAHGACILSLSTELSASQRAIAL